jgi:hypothetical protein
MMKTLQITKHEAVRVCNWVVARAEQPSVIRRKVLWTKACASESNLFLVRSRGRAPKMDGALSRDPHRQLISWKETQVPAAATFRVTPRAGSDQRAVRQSLKSGGMANRISGE